MHHVMIDLETLGTVPGCAILSIGAVEFFPDLNRLGQQFYTPVSTASCEEHYLEIDEEPNGTLDWWKKQSPEARAILDIAATCAVTLPAALEKLDEFLRQIGPGKDIRLYGNGADFDNPIIRAAQHAAGIKKPYASNYGGRCYRTLKNLDELFGPAFKAERIQRRGTHHNALDDAKSQALHLMQFVQQVREKVNV